MATTETLLFFTYGTLRRGGALHNWLEDNIVKDLGEATMPRTRLYYSDFHNAYPYLVADVPGFAAVGEVYELPINDLTREMLQMEQGAGYTIEDREAILADGTSLHVAVCTWRDKHRIGKPVPDNDWNSNAEMAW